MRTAVVAFLKDRSGVTGIEYGVMAFGVTLVLVSAAGAAGRHLKALFLALATLAAHGLSVH